MFLNLRKRSTEKEIMDDFNMVGPLLQNSLDKLAWINHWLGGNIVTLNGLKKLIKGIPEGQEIKIIDLGCGNGDMLRDVARYARKKNLNIRLIGIDANQFTVDYARKLSTDYPEISYLKEFIPSPAFSDLEYDVILSTLFFHHFTDDEILISLKEIISKAKIGVVINDLHRHEWAIFLFNILTLFIPNPMIRTDGLTSIRRGFKRSDLKAYENELGLKDSQISWKWAFRFQWVFNTSNR